jgi:hypothetical protein
MDRLAAVVLLASLPAQADVPGGHFYVGFGASVSKPLVSDQSYVWNPPGEPGNPPGTDLALSLELAFETTHAFAGISYEGGGLLSSQPTSFKLASLRVGVILGTGNVAPYLAAGAGHMSMSLRTPYDRGTQVEASGLALTAEAGVLLFRERQFGRVALGLRLIAPQFGLHPPSFIGGASQTSDRIPMLLFTTRLLL